MTILDYQTPPPAKPLQKRVGTSLQGIGVLQAIPVIAYFIDCIYEGRIMRLEVWDIVLLLWSFLGALVLILAGRILHRRYSGFFRRAAAVALILFALPLCCLMIGAAHDMMSDFSNLNKALPFDIVISAGGAALLIAIVIALTNLRRLGPACYDRSVVTIPA